MKQKTEEKLKKSFIELIKEKEYEAITVKELTDRAGVNRKTFYLHFDSLDDLLKVLQKEMVNEFIQKTKDYRRPEDLEEITREFYRSCTSDNNFRERLICSGSYSGIQQQITDSIMKKTWNSDNVNEYVNHMIMTFVSQSTLELFRQWVKDGKKIPMNQMIDLTTRLICNGVKDLDLRQFV